MHLMSVHNGADLSQVPDTQGQATACESHLTWTPAGQTHGLNPPGFSPPRVDGSHRRSTGLTDNGHRLPEAGARAAPGRDWGRLCLVLVIKSSF